MTRETRETRARSDVELLRDARAGDRAAFDQLYLRHRSAALRLARSYGGRDDADDLVNGAFEQVMAAMLRGGGPEGPFRPYLFVALRRLAMRRRGPGRHEPLDVLPDSALAARDLPALDDAERSLVTEAFRGLPDRWQAVLWQVAVEGRPPREVARGTGMSPNAVASLAYRARERLRQTYLQAHVGTGDGRCAPHRENLARYVRGSLHHRRRTELDAHLDGCAACARLLAELDDVNRLLTRAVLPLFVAGPGAGAPQLTGTAAGATAGTTAETGAGATVASSAAAFPAAASLAGAGAGALGLGALAKATIVAIATLVAGVAAVTVPGAHQPDPGHEVEIEAPPAGRATSADDLRPPRATSPPTTADDAPPTESPVPHRPDTAPDVAAPTDGAGADPGDASATSPAPPGGDAPGLDASIAGDPHSGLQLDASVDVAPGTGIDAGATVGAETGVDLAASWTAGPLGTGTLDVGLIDPEGSLVDAEIVVDLSPGARVADAGLDCTPADGGDGLPSLPSLRSIACGLDATVGGLTDTVSLPLVVTGDDPSATVHLQVGSRRLWSVVVALT